MIYRGIDIAQACTAQLILMEECGYKASHDNFVHEVRTDVLLRKHVCSEYRFCGALGFGGKFRNNGNRDNTPYVDCYPEDLTPGRQQMIDKANARLAELFAKDRTDSNLK